MKKYFLNLLKIIFSLILVIVLVYSSDVAKLYYVIIKSNYYILILSFMTIVISSYLATVKWHILLKKFNSNIIFMETFRLICLSFFYNIFVPGGFAGDIIRGYKCKNEKLNGTQGIASVLVDRMTGLVSFLLMGLLGMLFTFRMVKNDKISLIFIIVAVIVLITLMVFFNRNLIRYISNPSKRFVSIYNKFKQLYDSIYYYKNSIAILASAMILAFLATIGNIACFYLLGISIGCDASFSYFLFFIPIITVISYLPISYGGLGLREAGFVLLFGKVGIPREQVLAISLMYFGLLIVLGIMGGLVYLLTHRRNSANY